MSGHLELEFRSQTVSLGISEPPHKRRRLERDPLLFHEIVICSGEYKGHHGVYKDGNGDMALVQLDAINSAHSVWVKRDKVWDKCVQFLDLLIQFLNVKLRTDGTPLGLLTMTAKEVMAMNAVGANLDHERFQRFLETKGTETLDEIPGTPRCDSTIDPFTGLPIEQASNDVTGVDHNQG